MIELLSQSIHELTVDELKTLLGYYEDHEEKYKYEVKISQINRVIQKRTEKRIPEWIELAKEDRDTKEKWLNLGSNWECKGPYTTWYYKDTPFYTWWSKVSVNQEILKLREADKKLMGIIKSDAEG